MSMQPYTQYTDVFISLKAPCGGKVRPHLANCSSACHACKPESPLSSAADGTMTGRCAFSAATPRLDGEAWAQCGLATNAVNSLGGRGSGWSSGALSACDPHKLYRLNRKYATEKSVSALSRLRLTAERAQAIGLISCARRGVRLLGVVRRPPYRTDL